MPTIPTAIRPGTEVTLTSGYARPTPVVWTVARVRGVWVHLTAPGRPAQRVAIGLVALALSK